MIARLNGTVEAISEGILIINVGGIGYKVHASADALEHASMSSTIKLFTYMHVRENEMTLYGFASDAEQKLFEILIGVSGIGPKVALSILSGASPERLRSAIANEELDVFTRVPGVGPKTAKALVFHLKDKVDAVPASAASMLAAHSDDTEIIAALTELGYSLVEAQSALASIPADSDASLEERLRLTLAYFARPT